jgi:cytochrome c biogenesis protein CcmG, thiol:disulfide interchange protein DsbE
VAAAQPPDGAQAPERPGWRPSPLILGLLALSVAGMLAATVGLARQAGRSTTGPADATRLVPVPTVHVYPPGQQRAPDFRLTGLDGGTVDLTAYRGRPVVVNFWASWCRPCVKEFPLLADAHARYRADGLVVIGVLASNDTRDRARTFARDHGGGWPVGLDRGSGPVGETAIAYGVAGLPETYFVRRDGSLAVRQLGELSEGSLRESLAHILR